MSTDTQFDQLVEEITRRVRARLDEGGAAATPVQSLSSSGACSSGAAGCDGCGACHARRTDDVRKIVSLGADRVGATTGHGPAAADLAPLIDHTLLKADATKDELKKLCDEARKYGFATVCVNAANVRYCAAQLEGSPVKAIAVVGFPLGAGTGSAKAFEAREAVRHGAGEIDMVINIGALKSKDYATVLDDIAAVVSASSPKPVKVILETASLSHDEKVIASALAKVAGAAFVKTSTGFGPGGATAEDVALLRAIVGPEMGVKASGGIRTTEDARRMVDAGATRIGASASIAIVMGQSGDDKSRAKKPALRRVGSY